MQDAPTASSRLRRAGSFSALGLAAAVVAGRKLFRPAKAAAPREIKKGIFKTDTDGYLLKKGGELRLCFNDRAATQKWIDTIAAPRTHQQLEIAAHPVITGSYTVVDRAAHTGAPAHILATDGDGRILDPQTGQPVMFTSNREAAVWILKNGKNTTQALEIGTHPAASRLAIYDRAVVRLRAQEQKAFSAKASAPTSKF